MPRLRRSQFDEPGIVRRRAGRGFSYRGPDGRPVDEATLERVRALAVPPAWKDVWICPWPNGHVQAVGIDAAGRRQYRYHEQWRRHRDREKFDRMASFAHSLPALRRVVAADLATSGLSRSRVVAATVRLLDIGCLRIGADEYTAEHETFGASTLRRRHVAVHRSSVVFDYPAKGSKRRVVTVGDPDVRAVVAAALRRRGGGDRLFVYRDGGEWCAVGAHDVNLYLKEAVGEEHSAKEFRTWAATLLAATALAGEIPVPAAAAARRRAVRRAMATVADQLGNTPTVARDSYVDPRVVDRYHSGETIAAALAELAGAPRLDALELRPAIEEAVLALLEEDGR